MSVLGPGETEYLRLSAWAIFDEEGGEVLGVNAFDRNRPVGRFWRDEALEHMLRGEAGHVPAILREELLRLGLLVDVSKPSLPPPHGPDKRHSTPFLRRLMLDIELGDAWARQVDALAELCRAYAHTAPDWDLEVQVREAGEIARADGFTSQLLRHLALVKLDRERVAWRLRLGGLSNGDELPRLLDDWPDLQIVIEDRSELQGDHDRSILLEKAERLCREGFLLRPALVTRCSDSLLPAVDAWQRVTDRAGVLIEPLVLPILEEGPIRPVEEPAEFDVAFEVLAEVARSLETSLLVSEPWASILKCAAVPGSARYGWSKEVGGAYLDTEARWARSKAHADHMLFSSPRSLFPFLTASPSHSARPAIRGTSTPDCPMCPFAGLCDGYWSPEFDVLVRTGRPARAARLATLHCMLRKDLLTSLLSAIRAESKSPLVRGKTHAVFSNGSLSLHTEPSPEDGQPL